LYFSTPASELTSQTSALFLRSALRAATAETRHQESNDGAEVHLASSFNQSENQVLPAIEFKHPQLSFPLGSAAMF